MSTVTLDTSDLTIVELEPGESSNVKRYGYRRDTSVLFVVYKDGQRYEYGKVPPDLFDELRQADSVGKFLHTRIKGYFNTRKIEQ